MSTQPPEAPAGVLLPEERRRIILEQLGLRGRVLATDLCRMLQVSEDTIRRDLKELDEAGLLKRVHGGALPMTQGSVGRAFGAPQPAKQAVARVAAGLIRPGQVVFLDGGTTLLEVTRSLPPDLRATVITPSPAVAVALADYAGIEVHLVGGRMHPGSLTLVGAETVEAIRRVRADLCLLGVCSLHSEVGITNVYAEEASTKRAMIESASETAAVLTADKLGAVSPFVVAPASRLTTLVTEAIATEAQLAPFHKLQLRILTA
ncbi:DeoR/GlpR family DNA-binding transcription regulator [Vitiosangium sp. GDMCC 1.1324]|uniref:DeoR/GlpR family DNA-binding transcription regulator n=1 Tax=Vitiosangium sp. (strain GDMCC 1.1324) TaxID=2138576 RepID=UPI000D35E7F8|nr:DeoR/GlpR family DNA-binding transcription regulator [Vitiosangium sp. GDMCC 1.1324]PTL83641.1 DeoR family transcriptional regulator [Vitiosangium sp. GDMCC 1.1324]